MPYGVLIATPTLFKTACSISAELTGFVAKALSLEDRPIHDGQVTAEEIMIIPFPGTHTTNGKDIELIVVAHDYPERIANQEERKEQILKSLRHLLCRNICDSSVAVCLILVPMAYGEFRIEGMQS